MSDIIIGRQADFDAPGSMKCTGCGTAVSTAICNPELHKTRVLVFCATCAGTFTREKNYGYVHQDPHSRIRRPARCFGCQLLTFKVAINRHIPLPLAFCQRCFGKLISLHKWQQFHRNVRNEDLSGYAPNVLDLGTGSEVKQRKD